MSAEPRAYLLLRVVDAVTGAVVLEQTLTDLALAGTAAAYAATRALEHSARTRHTVVLEVCDPAGDILPAGRWVAADVVDPPVLEV